jgi:uncharacterized protein
MIEFHRLPAERFAALGSGLGGAAAVDDLAAAQRSKHLLLLRHLRDEWRSDDARRAVDVLIRADQYDPKIVSDLVGDPMVGRWAAETVRRGGEVPVVIEDDLAQLGALAAAAALRTGLREEIPTRTRSGRVALPTLGTADLGVDGRVMVSVDEGQAVFSSGHRLASTAGDDPRWRPLWRLTAEQGGAKATVVIDDCNPYRDCYHVAPAERLSHPEVARWQALFDEAWALLSRHLPERAAELATGLRTLVPLVTEDGMARSGTARDAFGATGLTRPGTAAEFAVTLVHEFQHSKLSALLDLVDLYQPGGDERHFAPWRRDPRPTAGLIQGVYAFLGVCDTWRGLRTAKGLDDQATREFAIMRRHTDVGLSALEASAELTEQGHAFVAYLREALSVLLAEAVPAAISTAADESLADLRRDWLENNADVETSATRS